LGITRKESENDIALKIEALKGAESKRIKEGLIRFKIENTWFVNNKITSDDLLMVRWNGTEWAKLVPSELKKDDTHTYYEAWLLRERIGA
jgi:PGF-pre-PGF domain-containing protein